MPNEREDSIVTCTHLLSRLAPSATADNSSDYAETHSAPWASLGFRHPLRSLSSCSARLRASC